MQTWNVECGLRVVTNVIPKNKVDGTTMKDAILMPETNLKVCEHWTSDLVHYVMHHVLHVVVLIVTTFIR